MIFVTLGNAKQEFGRLITAISSLQAALPEEMILVQYGYSSIDNMNIRGQKFYDKEAFEDLISKCDVLVTHSGAGTLVTAIQLGKYPLVWPRKQIFKEHINDHQLEICSEFQKLGYCHIVESVEDILESIHSNTPKEIKLEKKVDALDLEIGKLLKELELQKL